MKINWVSPLPPVPVEGAAYARQILPALAKTADVTVWTVQEEWDPGIEGLAPIRRFTGDFWRAFNQAEMSFYNIGNNAEAYGQIWEISRQHPGIVILHDFILQELFTKILVHYQEDPDSFRRIMSRFHGEKGLAAADEFIDGKINLAGLNGFPMWQAGADRALGLVLHSEAGLKTVQSDKRSLHFKTPLPFSPRVLPQPGPRDGNVFRIVDIANLDASRHLEPVIRAIADLPERDRIRLDAYGHFTEFSTLEEIVVSMGLQSAVIFHGIVPDEEIDQALASSDLAVHLVSPTHGEASMTQLRIWEHALPSLVLRDGWFQELDDSTVWFIRPEHQVEDIQEALSVFLNDPDHMLAVGRSGRHIVENTDDPAGYSKLLVEFARETRKSIPTALANRLIDSASNDIRVPRDDLLQQGSDRRPYEEFLELLSGS